MKSNGRQLDYYVTELQSQSITSYISQFSNKLAGKEGLLLDNVSLLNLELYENDIINKSQYDSWEFYKELRNICKKYVWDRLKE